MNVDIYNKRPQNLEVLSRMKDYVISEGSPDIRGWTLLDKNDDTLGKVDDLLIDTDTNNAVFIIARYGDVIGVGGSKTIIPLDRVHLDRNNKRVYFIDNADLIDNAPKFDDNIRDYSRFYDYWAGSLRTTGERPLSEEMVERQVTHEVVIQPESSEEEEEEEVERRRSASY